MDSPIENLSDLSYIPQVPDTAPDFIGNNSTVSNLGSEYTGMPSFQKAPVDFIQASIDKPIAPSEELKYQPQTFNYEKSQADRYVNDSNFQILNFNPNIGVENEYRYGRMQTPGQMWSNALGGAWRLGKQTFMEGWRGWGNITDAVFTNFGHIGEGTYWENFKNDLVGSPEHLLALDKETKDIMNRYAIYRTPESENSVFNRQLFGTMLQQSGFALGATAQFLTEELLTAGMATGFGLSKLGLKSAVVGGKAVRAGEVMSSALKLNSPWKLDNVMSGIYNAAVNTLRPVAMGQEFGKAMMAGASATQLAKIGLGGTKRLFAELNMATTEARMEAAGTYGELYNRMVEDYTARTGQMPVGAELTRIQNLAKVGADQNFIVNTGVIATMNRIQFDNLFTKFGLERRVLKEMGQYADDVVKVTGKAAAKEGEEAAAKEITKVYAKGQLGTLGTLGDIAKDFGTKRAAWEGAKVFGKGMFKWEASEGIQELIQEGSNIAIQDYYRDLYNGNPASWDKSISLAAAEQNPLTSIQGAQTFLMGAMTGRMIAPLMGGVQKAQELAMNLNKDVKDANQKRKADLESSVALINKFFESPSKVLSEHIANIQVQNTAAKEMETALANRDEYHYNNSKDTAFAKMVSAAKKTSMFESMLDTIRDFGQHLTPEQMKEAFPTVDPTENNIENAKQYFNRIADEVEGFSKTWEELQDKYGDMIMPELFKEGSEGRKQAEAAKMALDNAIEILATNKYKADRAAKRLSDLYSRVQTNTVIGNSSAQAFRLLGNENLINKEIEMLEKEIELFTSSDTKLDTEGRATLRTKKKELTQLKRWQKEWTASEGKDRMAKRGFAKLKKAYADYLQVRNEASNIDQPVTNKDIDDSWEFFLDHNELAKDNQDYIDAYNTLANPEAMAGILNNGRESILKLVDQLKAEAIARAEEEEKKPEEEETSEDLLETEHFRLKKENDGSWSIYNKATNAIVDFEHENQESAFKAAQELEEEQYPKDKGQEESADEKQEGEEEEQPEEESEEEEAQPEIQAAGDFLIIPLPKQKIKMTPPPLNKGERVIFSKNGLFIVYDSAGYQVLDSDRRNLTADKPTREIFYASEAGAKNVLEKALEVREQMMADRSKPFIFGDRQLQAGQVIREISTGKLFKVKSEGGPNGKGRVILKLLKENLRETNTSVEILPANNKNYKYVFKNEVKLEPGVGQGGKVFKFQRKNELARIYPVPAEGETREQAQKRLDDLITTTPKDELVSGLSVRAYTVSNDGKEYLVGNRSNNSLRMVGETLRMDVYYKGELIGRITNANSYRFYDKKGNRVAMKDLTKQQFLQIFDTQGKDADQIYGAFINYTTHSLAVYNAFLQEFIKNGNQPVDVSGEELSNILNLTVNSGEYDFLTEGTTPFDELEHKTVDGYIYIMDRPRRYNKKQGNTYDIPQGLAITDIDDIDDLERIKGEIAQILAANRDATQLLGRYVAVVRLPNGKLKFVELSTPVMEDTQLQGLIDKMAERSKLAKANNLKEGVKEGKITKVAKDATFNDALNTEIADSLFIALEDNKGTYLDLGVSPTGNLYVKVNKFVQGDKGVMRRVVNVGEVKTGSIDDFIKSINEAIVVHDKKAKTAERVELELKRSNFKISTPDGISASQTSVFQTKVSPKIVKNSGLAVTYNTNRKVEDVVKPKTQAEPKKKTSKKAAQATDVISDDVYQGFVDNNLVPDEVLNSIAEKIKSNNTLSPRELAIFTGQTAKVEAIIGKTATPSTQPQTTTKQDLLNERRILLAEREKFENDRFGELLDSGMSSFDADDQAKKEGYEKYGEKLEAIREKINKALKVTDRAAFDQQAVVTLESFKKWVRENLPSEISVEELDMIMDKSKANMVTAGMFISYLDRLNSGVKGKILTTEDAPFKYHEAFHAVFRLLLSDKRIEQLLNVARIEALAALRKEGKTLAQAIKEMKAQHPIYDTMTDKELEERYFEEYMADRFDEFMLAPAKSTVAPGIKGWFQKVLQWIKAIFNRLTRSEIDGLFADIKQGKYKNASIQNNRFTEMTSAMTEGTIPAMKILKLGTMLVEDENGNLIDVDQTLSQAKSDQLTSTIASTFVTRALSMETINKRQLIDGILKDYALLYNYKDPNRAAYYAEQEKLNFDRENSNYRYQIRQYQNEIKQMHDLFTIPENQHAIREAVDLHLRIMGFKQNLDDDAYEAYVDEYGDRITTENWNKETASIGGFSALSRFIRTYIASTTYPASDDFGNTHFTDGTPLLQAVNANNVYNGLLKVLANNSDMNSMVRRMMELADETTDTGRFVNKFIQDTGLVYNEDGTYEITNPKQSTLFLGVMKGLQQYAVDYLFINKDIRSDMQVSRISMANWNGANKAQFSAWSNAYIEIYENKLLRLKDRDAKTAFANDRTIALTSLAALMDPEKKISDAKLQENSKKISDRLKLDLGISLSPLFIKYSIIAAKAKPTKAQQRFLTAYSEVEAMALEDVRELEISIKRLENPFAKNIDSLKNDDPFENTPDSDTLGEGGVISRLNKMAKGNAVFDETVATTSFKNAEGELVYAFQLPTWHLVKVTEMNNPEVIEALKTDSFNENNTLLNSAEFEALQGFLKIARIEGMKQSILFETDEGDYIEDRTIKSNQNKGITYGKFNPREFITSLIDLYTYGKEHKTAAGKTFMTSQHLLRVLEASNTADTVALPVFAAVDSTDNDVVSLSTEALNRMFNVAVTEFERIKRVKDEIAQIDAGTFNGPVLKGYHTGAKRGLDFYKMKNSLGADLTKKILKKLDSNPQFDLKDMQQEIFVQLNEYWMDQLDNLINNLTANKVLEYVDEEDGSKPLSNRLLDGFIENGFSTLSDGKQSEDDRRNSLMNIKQGQIRHNIGQIFINDFLNTLEFNALLLGDEAKGLKDNIDAAKRARLHNASGHSIYADVLSPELGINHTFKELGFMTFTDPKYRGRYAKADKDKADAQMYMTAKGMRYTLFGLGRLTPGIAKILDKIEAGEKLTSDEIFGANGLMAMEQMFNSLKLVHFDVMSVKTSGVMLTKEFTSVKVNGKWVARPGMEELHELRERMEKYEESGRVSFAGPESLAKTIKPNIVDHKNGFTGVRDNMFVPQDTNFWRLQLENPSNKISITDPTQAKMLILAEQNDDTKVNYMGVETNIGKLKKLYTQDTAQRIENNFREVAGRIFNIDEAFKALNKSMDIKKLRPDLAKFQKQAITTLRASGADEQLLGFFELDKNGQPKYNLNHPITLQKYTELFMAYFSKGVMSEKIPGHSLALMSNWGVKVVKRFTGRYDETGAPIGEVIPRAEVEANYAAYAKAKRWNNEMDRQFEGLEVGDIYVDDLRHNVPEYDKNGKIIGRYSEFMMPPHFKEYMELMGKEAFEEFITKAFGVRIPSQDKHSFISLKLVDWMPAYYGSTGIFPHELIEISGADFDIDKLYMHIADTFVKEGKRIAYGTAKTITGKYEEFLAYQLDHNREFRQAVRDRLLAITREQISEFYDEKSRKFQELKDNPLQERREVIREYMVKYSKLSPETIDIILKNISDEDIDRLNQAAFTEKGRKFHRTKDSIQGMAAELADTEEEEKIYFKRLSDLKRGIQQYNRLRDARNLAFDALKAKYDEDFDGLEQLSLDTVDLSVLATAAEAVKFPGSAEAYAKATAKKELNNGVLNNRILYAKIALLTNDYISKVQEGEEMPKAFEVATVDPLKDIVDEFIEVFSDVEELQAILQEPISDIDSFVGKLAAYTNNKEGSRNIGPAVNSMLVYSLLNTAGVKFRETYLNKDNEPEPLYRLQFNGEILDGYTRTKTQDGERIFGIISTVVSAMTDNAKERLAARLGLNIEAVGIVSNLLAQGMGLRSAIKLIMQPSIRRYFDARKDSRGVLGADDFSESKRSIITKLLSEYMPEDNTLPVLNDALLDEGLRDNGKNHAIQASVLYNFANILDQSEFFSNVASLIKLTKGLGGTDFTAYDKVIETITELGYFMTPAEFEKSTIPFNIRPAIEQNDFLKNLVDIAVNQISVMSRTMFLERSKVFQEMKQMIVSNLSIRKTVWEQFNKDISQDLISYLSIKAYMKDLRDKNKTGRLETMTNALIFDAAAEKKGEDFDDIGDIVSTIREVLPTNYLVNNFLNMIRAFRRNADGEVAVNEYNKDGFNKLESNSWAKNSDYMINKLRNSFIELYSSNEDFGNGRNGRHMATALFNYLLVKDGGQFRSGSFIRYLPTFIFDDLLEATGKVNELLKLDNLSDDNAYREVFDVTAEELLNDFMKGYTTHKGNEIYIKRVNLTTGTQRETGNAEVDEWTPGAVKERKNSILVSLFGNIRKTSKQLQDEALDEAGFTIESYEDAEGNTFFVRDMGIPLPEWKALEIEAEERAAGTYKESAKKKKGKYDKTEKAKFVKNIMDLKAKGFVVKDGVINFPYIIKVTKLDDDGVSKVRVPYILKAVGKRGESKKGEGAVLSSLIQPADFEEGNYVPNGVEAVYVPFEYKGSKKTFKAGFVFDEIPALAKKPRVKFTKSTDTPQDPNYWEKVEAESELTELSPEEALLYDLSKQDVQPVASATVVKQPGEKRNPKEILFQDYGISFEFSNNAFKFKGAKYDALVNETGKIPTTPQLLLKALGYEQAENKVSTPEKQNPLEDKCAQPGKSAPAPAPKKAAADDSSDTTIQGTLIKSYVDKNGNPTYNPKMLEFIRNGGKFND